jgi:hypothetical protein
MILHPDVLTIVAEGFCASACADGEPCVCKVNPGKRCHAREIYRDAATSVVVALRLAGYDVVRVTTLEEQIGEAARELVRKNREGAVEAGRALIVRPIE